MRKEEDTVRVLKDFINSSKSVQLFATDLPLLYFIRDWVLQKHCD